MNKPTAARKTETPKKTLVPKKPAVVSKAPIEKKPVAVRKPPVPAKPTALLETNFGGITVELWPDKAPRHVENFVKLTEKGAYSNLLFHRVIPGFMIQTGCPKGDGTGGPGWRVPAEFNDARFVRGTVGMARGAHRDSAGSQFFICVADAPHLNGSYTAFGKVVDGLDVADQIAKVERDRRDRPVQEVRMTKVVLKKSKG